MSEKLTDAELRSAPRKPVAGMFGMLRRRLWDFIMLFLAVVAGFFADSFRESLNDRKSGKVYLEAMVQDLQYDTALIRENIERIQEKIPYFDSVLYFLKHPGQYGYRIPQRIYMPTYSEHIFQPMQATYQQMKYTGKLRLIPDLDVLDSLMDYHENVLGDIKNNTGLVRDYYKRYISEQEHYFDLEPFNDYLNNESKKRNPIAGSNYALTLVNRDPAKLLVLRNLVVSTKASELEYIHTLDGLSAEAIRLIRFIRKNHPERE
jgi:hypothetical protein